MSFYLPRNFGLVALITMTVILHMLLQPSEGNEGDNSQMRQLENKMTVSSNDPLSNSQRPKGFLAGNQRNQRSIYGFGPRKLQISRSKIPIELDLLVENDDSERSKRFDDYGHMRFGKRGGEDQFDDYGHMRFGKK